MQKHLKVFLLAIVTLVLSSSMMIEANEPTAPGLPQHNAAERGSNIKWYTNLEEATKLSESSGKPIVLFFTGSDWCGWCTKLEEEVLNTADFSEAAHDKFIFVKLDFPMNTKLDPATTAQNKRLQQKYQVKGYPTLVIIDAKENQIAQSSYMPGGGKKYASHLRMIAER